ncbi:MAG: hypothetical protein EU541_06210, partial [Promethearchaeota archaeon]
MEQKRIYLVLSYFDSYQGPIPFISFPEKVPSNIESVLTDLMNLDLPETFFQLEIKKKIKGKFLNRPIMLPSKWARGGQERMLLSVVVPHEMNTLFIDFLFENFVEQLKTHPEIFRAFYVNRKTESECKIQYNVLSKILQ